MDTLPCPARLLTACLGALLPALVAAQAEPADEERWNAKFQTTYVWQSKQPFSAAYSGTNSLSPLKEKSYSFTATAALGLRPWAGGEFYLNPEAAQGVALSGLTGLGGFPNGELARTSGPKLTVYRARAFLRQSWGLGGGSEAVESDANQLAGKLDKQRVVLTAGNLSVIDIFDDNAYSHDPRTQFMNWSIMTHGAYDFAADARGYSWGLALEYIADGWALRAGRFIQPKEPNGQSLDHRIFRHYGDQIELERGHSIAGQPGKVRLLLYRNQATMARFADATAQGQQTGRTPELNAVRAGDRSKMGIGVNLEQALTPDLGLFARAMGSDGKTEAYAFTEIDRSISTGLLAKGSAWGRAMDQAGLALAVNGLSRAHRDYLKAGGLGFFIGDGQLRYRPETIAEAFYSLQLLKNSYLSFDWQYIRNPAYNADRGPVTIYSARLHAEF